MQLALSGSPKVTLGSPDKASTLAAQQSTVSVAESHAAPAARTESARRMSFNASIANKLPSEAHGLLKVFLYCRYAYISPCFSVAFSVAAENWPSASTVAFDASQEAERMFIDLDAKYEIACMKEIGVDSIGLTLLSVCPTE